MTDISIDNDTEEFTPILRVITGGCSYWCTEAHLEDNRCTMRNAVIFSVYLDRIFPSPKVVIISGGQVVIEPLDRPLTLRVRKKSPVASPLPPLR